MALSLITAAKRKAKEGKISDLTTAARYNSSVEVMQTLIAASPESLLRADHDGCLPIHNAARYNSSVEIMQALITASPESLLRRDNVGCLPIHYAARYNSSVEVLQALVSASPESVLQGDQDGWLPIHYAERNNSSVEVVQVFITARSEGLLQGDKQNGWLPIHYAIINKNSVEVLQALITASPESLLRKDKDGWLPIHYAARYNSSMEVIQALITACPESLLRGDKDGCLLIHHAIINKNSLKRLQIFITACPESLLLGDKDGWLPIHYAVRNYISVEVMQALITASSESLLRGDKDGCLPIHCAARYNPSVEMVQALITASPASLLRGDKDGCLPIHHFVRNDCSQEVVKTLIAASPDSLVEGDKLYGCLPIHYAIINKNSVEVLQALISASPESLLRIDKYGWLPIHYAARYNSSVEVLQNLIRAKPDSLLRGNIDGCLPIHYAASNNSSVKVMQVFITSRPESLLRADKDGWLPIHYAFRFKSSVEVMQALITASPESLLRGDKDSWLPIHHAARYNSSVEVMQALITASPESLLRGDMEGCLPVHFAARYSSSVEVVQALITASPESFLRTDKGGWLPIHHAARNNSSVEVLKALITASPESLLRADKNGDFPIKNSLICNFLVLRCRFVRSYFLGDLSLDKLRQVVFPHSLVQALSFAEPLSSSTLTVHVCGQKLAGKSTLTSWLVSQLEQQPSFFGPLARLTVSAKSKDIIPFDDRTPGMVSHRVQGKAGEQFTVHDYGGHEEFWMTYRQFLNAPRSVYIVVLPLVEKRSDTEHCPFKVSALAAQYEAWLNLIISSLQLKDGTIKKTGDAPLPVVITVLNRFSGTVPQAERESTVSVRAALTACQGQEPFKSRFRFYQPILAGDVLNEHDSMAVREAIASAARPILQTQGQSRECVKFIADLQASFEAEPAADFLVESAYRADVQRRLRASGYQDEEELPLLQLLEDCWMDHCMLTRRVAVVQRRAGREAVVATSVSALSNKLFGKVLDGMRRRRCVVIERQDVAEIVKADMQVGLEVDAADLLVELHLFLRIAAYDASTGQVELQAAGQAAESSPRDKFLVIGLIERRAAAGDIVLPDFRAETSRRVHRFYALDRRRLASWGSGFFMSLFLRILSLVADCVSPRIFKDGLSAMAEDGRRRTRYLVRPSRRAGVGDGFELVVDVSAEDASALSFAEVAREDDEVLRGVRAVSAEVRRLLGEAVLEYCTYPDPRESLEDMLSSDAEAKLAQAEAAGLRTRFQLRKYLYGHYPIESVVRGQEGAPQRVVEGLLTAAQFAAGIQLLQSQVEKSLEITSALYQQFAEASQATLQQLDRLERDIVGDRAGQPSSTEADDIGAGEQQGGGADLEGLLQEVREGREDLRDVARSVEDMEQTLDNIFRAQLSLSRGMCDFPLLVVLEEAPWRLTQALRSVVTKPYCASCICPVCRQRVAPSAAYELRASRGKWAKYLLRALQVSVVLGGMALRAAGVPGAAADVVYECTKSALSAVSQELGAELAQFSGDIKQAVASCVGVATSAAAQNQSSSMLPGQQLQLLQQPLPPGGSGSGSVGQEVVVSIEYIHAMKALFARSLQDPAAERSGLVRVTSDQGDVAFVCGDRARNCRQEFKEKGRRCLSVVVTFGG